MNVDSPLLLGTHVSIAGGVEKAFPRGEAVGCTAIQIFSKNASRWQSPPLKDENMSAFRTAFENSSIRYVAVHDSYLINLASPDPDLRKKSINAFVDEMVRCSALGIQDLVMHPGAHVGAGINAGLQYLAESFQSVFGQAPGDVRVLVENTAGQGTCLGARFEELAKIIEPLANRPVAICFDTCHAFAAGYDLGSAAGYARVMDEFEHLIGLDRLMLFHLNDSKKQLGSRVDRHDHVGRGLIGPEGFAALMRDRRFFQVPKIIETPPGEKHCDDLTNLALLRQFAGLNERTD